jgi:hypothetical protein
MENSANRATYVCWFGCQSDDWLLGQAASQSVGRQSMSYFFLLKEHLFFFR